MGDDYEREAMPGIGPVLYRHKVTSPRLLIALLTLLPAAMLGGTGAALGLTGVVNTSGALAFVAGGAALAALFGGLSVVFAAGRIAVSEGELHVQIGLAGPRIPIAEIAGVSIGPSGGNKLGLGGSIDLAGNRYLRLWGRNERAVRVALTNGTRLVLTTKDPDGLASAIEEALRRRDRPKVRVEPTEQTDAPASDPGASTEPAPAPRRAQR
jgi:hypothetical protein